MREHYRYLLVGAGMAADAAARGIREVDPDGSVLIVGREPTAPVERPALSKGLWTDPEVTVETVALGTAEDTGAELLLGTTVVALDPAARTVTTDTGATIGYDRALLATSGSARTGGVPESGRVLAYRTLRDYERLRDLAGGGRHVVVVGGGFIGTEVAAALALSDTRVTLVVSSPVLTGQIFPDDLARRVQRRYEEAGVRVLTGVRATGGESGPDGVRVTLDDGRVLDADAVVVGAGIALDLSLAVGAGIEVADGVLVDDRLRTSVPDVWAAGDVAEYPDRLLGRRRVEHVDQARASGRQAGRNMAGADEAYEHTPFFYSDLFDLGYEAVGRLDAALPTVEDWRGGEVGDTGVVYYLDPERTRVVGVLLWNVWDATDAAREVIAGQRDVSATGLRGRIG